MTFRCVATVRDGRKSVLAAKRKFWSVREREGEWQTITSGQIEGADTGAVGQEMGRDNSDDPLATTKVASQQPTEEEERRRRIWRKY